MDNRRRTTINYFPTQTILLRGIKTPAANSGFKKLAVQWLNNHLCFVSGSMVADSLVLRSRQLLKPAKRYNTFYPAAQYD